MSESHHGESLHSPSVPLPVHELIKLLSRLVHMRSKDTDEANIFRTVANLILAKRSVAALWKLDEGIRTSTRRRCCLGR